RLFSDLNSGDESVLEGSIALLYISRNLNISNLPQKRTAQKPKKCDKDQQYRKDPSCRERPVTVVPMIDPQDGENQDHEGERQREGQPSCHNNPPESPAHFVNLMQ